MTSAVLQGVLGWSVLSAVLSWMVRAAGRFVAAVRGHHRPPQPAGQVMAAGRKTRWLLDHGWPSGIPLPRPVSPSSVSDQSDLTGHSPAPADVIPPGDNANIPYPLFASGDAPDG